MNMPEVSAQGIRDEVRAKYVEKGPNTYFITQTLKPKFYKFNINLQRELTQNTIGQLLKEFSKEFILTCELTKQGNVHYHAIVVFKNSVSLIRFIEQTKKKNYIGMSRVTPAPILHDEGMVRSKEYLIKDVDKTIKFINGYFVLRLREDYKFNI